MTKKKFEKFEKYKITIKFFVLYYRYVKSITSSKSIVLEFSVKMRS